MVSNRIVAVQNSRLVLQKVEAAAAPPALSSPRHTDLKFEQTQQPKTAEAATKAKQLLKQLNSQLEKHESSQAAATAAELIGHMNRVPEEQIPELLQQIRQGAFGSNKQKLESLYLDSVAFIENAGAVKLMVQEITSQVRISFSINLSRALNSLMRSPRTIYKIF